MNLRQLTAWVPAVEITPESLRNRGLLKSEQDGVKILGTLSDKALPSGLRFRDVLFSNGAREALTAAGAQFAET